MADEGGFLARWSRRKRAVPEEQAALAPETAPPAATVEPAVRLNLPDVPDVGEPEFDLASLPTLEEVTGASDMSAFLQKGVPDALRNAALRKAWVLDPFIKDHIGPVECGWDFNDPNSMTGFGALDANVDPAAMLRQIMGDVEKDEEIAGQSALDEAVEAADSVESRSAAGEPEDEPGPADLPHTDVSTHVGEPVSLEMVQPSTEFHAALHNDSIDKIEEIPHFSRKRRHGGAVPG